MKRWWAAIANSWNGIVACARSEAAFREEIVALVLAIPAAMVLSADPWKRALLLSPLVLLLVIELLNTAIEAAIEAASVRLRPILMTSIAFLLGVVPLMVAKGAGAAARNSLGTAVFGGMLVSTVVNLVFIPGLYVLIQRKAKVTRPVEDEDGETPVEPAHV